MPNSQEGAASEPKLPLTRDWQPDLADVAEAPTLPPKDPAPVTEASLRRSAAAHEFVDDPTSRSPTITGSVRGYEILAELGRGGMGVVYKAQHIALNRLVALKMILAGGHAGSHDRARFRTEAEAVARLQHPNIVQIYEIGEHDDLPYFSLEFCDGGSLANRLDGTPLPPKEAAQLVETLARAMHHAHERGIIHRDLKAGQCPIAIRNSQNHRFRTGEEARCGPWTDTKRCDHGHAELHGPRTGRRQDR